MFGSLALGMAAVCSADVPPAPSSDSAVLLAEIQHEIGAAACDKNTHCRTLAIGAKACGGPQAYLPWSTQSTRAARIKLLAARHREAQQAENARTEVMSDCAVVTDPGAVCAPRTGAPSDSRMVCQLARGAAAASAR